MGTIYDKDSIKLSLYDKSQNHGHLVSHIHAKDHGKTLWLTAEGDIKKGSSQNATSISKWIKEKQPEIKERLRLLAEGKEITLIEGDIK